MTQDLVGTRYGRLVVVSINRRDKHHTYWNCICDCGNEKVAYQELLKNGNTSSCGCYRKELARARGKQNLLENEFAGFNRIFYQYQHSATYRKIPFELNQEEFNILIKRPCTYCGKKDSNLVKVNGRHREFYYNGIDRVDNAKGYCKDNCVPCCRNCNKAKGTMSLVEFKNWIDAVYNTINSETWGFSDKELQVNVL